MDSALGYLSRRPDPAGRDAVREAVIAVAAVVHSLRRGDAPPSVGIVVGSVEPVREKLGLPAGLAGGIEAIVARCHALSGLPGAPPGGEPPDPSEATFLVVFCASVIRLLLDRATPAGQGGGG